MVLGRVGTAAAAAPELIPAIKQGVAWAATNPIKTSLLTTGALVGPNAISAQVDQQAKQGDTERENINATFEKRVEDITGVIEGHKQFIQNWENLGTWGLLEKLIFDLIASITGGPTVDEKIQQARSAIDEAEAERLALQTDTEIRLDALQQDGVIKGVVREIGELALTPAELVIPDNVDGGDLYSYEVMGGTALLAGAGYMGLRRSRNQSVDLGSESRGMSKSTKTILNLEPAERALRMARLNGAQVLRFLEEVSPMKSAELLAQQPKMLEKLDDAVKMDVLKRIPMDARADLLSNGQFKFTGGLRAGQAISVLDFPDNPAAAPKSKTARTTGRIATFISGALGRFGRFFKGSVAGAAAVGAVGGTAYAVNAEFESHTPATDDLISDNAEAGLTTAGAFLAASTAWSSITKTGSFLLGRTLLGRFTRAAAVGGLTYAAADTGMVSESTINNIVQYKDDLITSAKDAAVRTAAGDLSVAYDAANVAGAAGNGIVIGLNSAAGWLGGQIVDNSVWLADLGLSELGFSENSIADSLGITHRNISNEWYEVMNTAGHAMMTDLGHLTGVRTDLAAGPWTKAVYTLGQVISPAVGVQGAAVAARGVSTLARGGYFAGPAPAAPGAAL